MKIFKNFKTKKQLKAEIEELKRDYEELKKKLNGERVCSAFCQICENGLEVRSWTGLYYECRLNCHCKNFERKESEEE